MKKILLAIDAEKSDPKSLDFACRLAQLTGSPLTGVFLENAHSENVPGLKFAYGGVYVETIDTLAADFPTQKAVDNNVDLFKTTCKAHMVAYDIYSDRHDPVETMIAESRFADMMILNPTCFASSPLEKPSAFVKELLSRSECPVIISPYDFDEVNEIIFAYDGSASSVFAIKQFTYLFPELRTKKATILQAGEKADLKTLDREKLSNYLTNHYPEIVFEYLAGNSEDVLFNHLLRKKNAFAVMGAYGRSKLSNFLKHSTAEFIIEANSLSMFIAHH